MSDDITSAPVVDAVSSESSESDTSSSLSPSESANETANPSSSVAKTEPEKKIEKAIKRKLKLKVDGKDIEEEFDPADDEYLTRQFQMAKVAQKRMAEKAMLEKQVSGFIEELRKNPRKVLNDPDLGVDFKKMVQEFIDEEIENSRKSPEQLEKEKLESELKAIKDEYEREKQEFRAKELERLQNETVERYDMLITQSLEKSDLPKSPYVVKKISDYMILGLQERIDVTPEDVIPLVRDEIQEDLRQMFAVMPEEVIEKLVGKEVIGKIRKKRVAAAKSGTPPTPLKSSLTDTGTKQEGDAAKKAAKKSYKDFFGV